MSKPADVLRTLVKRLNLPSFILCQQAAVAIIELIKESCPREIQKTDAYSVLAECLAHNSPEVVQQAVTGIYDICILGRGSDALLNPSEAADLLLAALSAAQLPAASVLADALSCIVLTFSSDSQPNGFCNLTWTSHPLVAALISNPSIGIDLITSCFHSLAQTVQKHEFSNSHNSWQVVIKFVSCLLFQHTCLQQSWKQQHVPQLHVTTWIQLARVAHSNQYVQAAIPFMSLHFSCLSLAFKDALWLNTAGTVLVDMLEAFSRTLTNGISIYSIASGGGNTVNSYPPLLLKIVAPVLQGLLTACLDIVDLGHSPYSLLTCLYRVHQLAPGTLTPYLVYLSALLPRLSTKDRAICFALTISTLQSTRILSPMSRSKSQALILASLDSRAVSHSSHLLMLQPSFLVLTYSSSAKERMWAYHVTSLITKRQDLLGQRWAPGAEVIAHPSIVLHQQASIIGHALSSASKESTQLAVRWLQSLEVEVSTVQRSAAGGLVPGSTRAPQQGITLGAPDDIPPLITALLGIALSHTDASVVAAAVSATCALTRIAPLLPLSLLPCILRALTGSSTLAQAGEDPQAQLALLRALPALASDVNTAPLVMRLLTPMLAPSAPEHLRCLGLVLLFDAWRASARHWQRLEAALLGMEASAPPSVLRCRAVLLRRVCEVDPESAVDLVPLTQICGRHSDPFIATEALRALLPLCASGVLDPLTAWQVVSGWYPLLPPHPSLAAAWVELMAQCALAEVDEDSDVQVRCVRALFGALHHQHKAVRAAAAAALLQYPGSLLERLNEAVSASQYVQAMLEEEDVQVRKKLEALVISALHHEFENRRTFSVSKASTSQPAAANREGAAVRHRVLYVLPSMLAPNDPSASKSRSKGPTSSATNTSQITPQSGHDPAADLLCYRLLDEHKPNQESVPDRSSSKGAKAAAAKDYSQPGTSEGPLLICGSDVDQGFRARLESGLNRLSWSADTPLSSMVSVWAMFFRRWLSLTVNSASSILNVVRACEEGGSSCTRANVALASAALLAVGGPGSGCERPLTRDDASSLLEEMAQRLEGPGTGLEQRCAAVAAVAAACQGVSSDWGSQSQLVTLLCSRITSVDTGRGPIALCLARLCSHIALHASAQGPDAGLPDSQGNGAGTKEARLLCEAWSALLGVLLTSVPGMAGLLGGVEAAGGSQAGSEEAEDAEELVEALSLVAVALHAAAPTLAAPILERLFHAFTARLSEMADGAIQHSLSEASGILRSIAALSIASAAAGFSSPIQITDGMAVLARLVGDDAIDGRLRGHAAQALARLLAAAIEEGWNLGSQDMSQYVASIISLAKTGSSGLHVADSRSGALSALGSLLLHSGTHTSSTVFGIPTALSPALLEPGSPLVACARALLKCLEVSASTGGDARVVATAVRYLALASAAAAFEASEDSRSMLLGSSESSGVSLRPLAAYPRDGAMVTLASRLVSIETLNLLGAARVACILRSLTAAPRLAEHDWGGVCTRIMRWTSTIAAPSQGIDLLELHSALVGLALAHCQDVPTRLAPWLEEMMLPQRFQALATPAQLRLLSSLPLVLSMLTPGRRPAVLAGMLVLLDVASSQSRASVAAEAASAESLRVSAEAALWIGLAGLATSSLLDGRQKELEEATQQLVSKVYSRLTPLSPLLPGEVTALVAAAKDVGKNTHAAVSRTAARNGGSKPSGSGEGSDETAAEALVWSLRPWPQALCCLSSMNQAWLRTLTQPPVDHSGSSGTFGASGSSFSAASGSYLPASFSTSTASPALLRACQARCLLVLSSALSYSDLAQVRDVSIRIGVPEEVLTLLARASCSAPTIAQAQMLSDVLACGPLLPSILPALNTAAALSAAWLGSAGALHSLELNISLAGAVDAWPLGSWPYTLPRLLGLRHWETSRQGVSQALAGLMTHISKQKTGGEGAKSRGDAGSLDYCLRIIAGCLLAVGDCGDQAAFHEQVSAYVLQKSEEISSSLSEQSMQ